MSLSSLWLWSRICDDQPENTLTMSLFPYAPEAPTKLVRVTMPDPEPFLIPEIRKYFNRHPAERWQLRWLKTMDASEQRLIACDLECMDMTNALIFWGRDQFSIDAPGLSVTWRVVCWNWNNRSPSLTFAQRFRSEVIDLHDWDGSDQDNQLTSWAANVNRVD